MAHAGTPDEGERRRAWVRRAGVIILVTLAVYIPAMRGGFIWDDDVFFTEGSLIQSSDGLRLYWFSTEPPDYFPLTYTTLWLEWRVWGTNATGYHVTNVLLHALSAVLVWRVLEGLKVPGAWLAGLVFGIHPVNVASVAWITERKNTLSLVFYLLTILCYFKAERDPRRRWYALSLVMFLLALLSKTSVVMLPFVLLGCVWWQRRRIVSRDVLRTVPFFILSLVMGLVTVWFQQHRVIGAEVVRTGGFFSRLATAGCAVWFYLYKALIPCHLSMVYPRWEIDPTSFVSYLPGAALVACFLVLWTYRNRWARAPLFGLGYFVMTLGPVLGFFTMYFMKYSLVADHWQYVSLIGVIGLVVGLASHAGTLWGAGQRKLAGVTGVAVLGALGLLTWTESRAYGDSEALWKKTVSENPRAWIAQGSLGMALTERGQTKAALEHFSRALRSEPHDAKTHNNMGIALGLEGRFSEASAHFEESLGLKPNQAEVHNNLGYALAQQGKLVGAVVHYRAALRLAPEDARVHKNLADALARLGEASEAIRAYRHALYRRPDWPEAMDRLARILATHHDARLRSGTQAVRLAEQACELTQRRNASFLDTLAAAYAEKGRFSEAVKTAQEAQELAAASGKKDLAETIGKRLLLYRSNQPSHEAPPAVTP